MLNRGYGNDKGGLRDVLGWSQRGAFVDPCGPQLVSISIAD
jgi:hypothetical protein